MIGAKSPTVRQGGMACVSEDDLGHRGLGKSPETISSGAQQIFDLLGSRPEPTTQKRMSLFLLTSVVDSATAINTSRVLVGVHTWDDFRLPIERNAISDTSSAAASVEPWLLIRTIRTAGHLHWDRHLRAENGRQVVNRKTWCRLGTIPFRRAGRRTAGDGDDDATLPVPAVHLWLARLAVLDQTPPVASRNHSSAHCLSSFMVRALPSPVLISATSDLIQLLWGPCWLLHLPGAL